jgi:TPM domain
MGRVIRLTSRPRLLGASLVAAVLAFGMPSIASAEEVMRLEGPVTDTPGALDGRASEVEAVIERTLNEHRVQVFVLFVRTTGDLPMVDYAQRIAALNSLGVDDALVAVAMDDRTDYIWVSDGLDEITDDELDTILRDQLEPSLRDGDAAGGAIATIESLGIAADSPAPTEGPIAPGPVTPEPGGGSGGTANGGGIGWGLLLSLLLLAIGAWVVYRSWQRREAGAAAPPTAAPPKVAPAQLSGPELRRQANAQLIATDERIRDARQEVDFAEAQYGSDAVRELLTAIDAAQAELATSFTLRQQIDDDVPEDDAAREGMLREIVERTQRALATLDAETGQIRKLRDLERDAPATLVELPARIEHVEDRLAVGRTALDAIQAYAASAWRPVAGHLEEVEKGLDGARNAVIVGSAAMAKDDRPDVAVATLEALEGVTGSTELLDAIDRLAATLAEAEARLPGELAESDRDLRDVRSALGEMGELEPGMAGRVREAERAIDAAHEAAKEQPLDPVEALRLATEAHRVADALLVAVRDVAAARDRLEAAARSSLATATTEYERAATFIASRRRGIGDAARTRLAEAQRNLEAAAAIVSRDPQSAIDRSRRAQQLAEEAYRLAASDFTGWDQGGPGWGQPSGTSGDATAEILGQILGGVIGGVIRSGGGGGWGGSPWGTPSRRGGGGFPDLGGLSGGWGRTGGFGTGGFGGGGGGGRGRGGRW